MDSDYEENKKQAGESSDEESKLLIKILSSKSAEAISAPLPMDIICGRGKSISHAGNQRLRELVLAKKDAYQKAQRRDDKTRITLELVEELRRGSRFLLKDPTTGIWYDVGDEYAREKVSHALRSKNDRRRKRPKAKKKNARKPQHSRELEETAQRLIKDQQQLLKSMIGKARYEESVLSTVGGIAM